MENEKIKIKKHKSPQNTTEGRLLDDSSQKAKKLRVGACKSQSVAGLLELEGTSTVGGQCTQ